MSEAIQKRTKTLRDLIVSQRDQIAMALPSHMNVDRLIRISISAMRMNPDILDCSQVSVLGSIIQAAQLGLETDGAIGHAYLVPYKNKKTNSAICQLQIGYRGMIELALRSGRVTNINARVVHANDKFEYAYGLEDKLVHTPCIGDRGPIIAVYAVAHLNGGGHQFEVLSRDEVIEVQQQSPSKKGPWLTHWREMAKKTAVRRLFKYLPVSVEIQRAVGLEDKAEAGIPQYNETIFTEAEILPNNDEPEPQGLSGVTQKLKEKQQEKQQEKKTDPVVVDEKAFDPIGELVEIAKERFGKKYKSQLAATCEKEGIDLENITPDQAGHMIDVLCPVS
jgi:recombination protein RecT